MNKTEKAVVRILIIDDDMGLLNELEEALSGEGREVHTANSAFLAKTLSDKHRFDILAVDGDLKDGGGIKTTSKLVEDMLSENKDITAIAISVRSEHNAVLCNSGCKFRIRSEKIELIRIIDSILLNMV